MSEENASFTKVETSSIPLAETFQINDLRMVLESDTLVEHEGNYDCGIVLEMVDGAYSEIIWIQDEYNTFVIRKSDRLIYMADEVVEIDYYEDFENFAWKDHGFTSIEFWNKWTPTIELIAICLNLY